MTGPYAFGKRILRGASPHTTMALCCGLLCMPLLACATPQASNAGTDTLVVRADANAPLYAGPASMVWRRPAHVVAVPGFGEIQVDASAAPLSCRFVWSTSALHDTDDARRTAARLQRGMATPADGGALQIALYPGTGCTAPQNGALCFDHAVFTRPKNEGALPGAGPASVVVTGCAHENDLLEQRLGDAPATVGPTAYHRRCVPIDTSSEDCALTFVRLRALTVQSDPAPRAGFSFSYDGDRWLACFSEQQRGAYAMRLQVQDSCGQAREVDRSGDSADLAD